MPVKVRTRRVATLTDEGHSFDLSGVPSFPDDVITEKLPNGMTMVGYLEDDSDCPHPLEDSDGMGHIYRWDRDGTRESKQQGFEEMGLDQYGDEDPDKKRNPYAVLLDKYEHGLVMWSVAGSLSTEHWDTSRNSGVWVPEDSCLEHIKSCAIKGLLPEGTVVAYKSEYNPDETAKFRPCRPGETNYFSSGIVPDERYNNVMTITYPDGTTKGGYKNFVTAYRAAAKKLGIKIDKEAIAKGEQVVARECAQQACRIYTDWCNGNCFGYAIDVFDAAGNAKDDDRDTCCGFVGSDDGEESLKDAMKSLAKRLSR